MAATPTQIRKLSRTDHEQNDFVPRLHPTDIELDYILSPLAPLYLVVT